MKKFSLLIFLLLFAKCCIYANNKNDNSVDISLDKDTYILPFYYTQSPNYSVYNGNTPSGQKINKFEFKGQFSLKINLLRNLLNTNTNVYFGYTQLMYWQLYGKDPFFRETNYMPELYFSHSFLSNTDTLFGIIHDSNGRGGKQERSWNRVFLEQKYKINNFYVDVKPWIIVFKNSSIDLHNPDIADYLGHVKFTLALNLHNFVFQFSTQNNLESAFKYGSETLDLSYPIYDKFRFFMQIFSGYGQSLIEYNHYTNAFGIGISFNSPV